MQSTQKSQKQFWKRTKLGEFALISKMYYKISVIMILWYWHKKHRSKGKDIESRNKPLNKQRYTCNTFPCVPFPIQRFQGNAMRKAVFSTNDARTRYLHAKRTSTPTSHHTHTKWTQKESLDHRPKPNKTTKLLEKIMRENLCYLGITIRTLIKLMEM